MKKPPPPYIANFDSATAMSRALGRFLQGKDFPSLGLPPAGSLTHLANRLPERAREVVYSAGSGGEAIPGKMVDKVKAEELSKWVTGLYPRGRRYPAIAIGSSSGALVHLCAALGIPWLPQTFLIPIAQPDGHPDDAREGLEAAREAGARLLDANPELQLHHMHDPNQDRLTLQLMTYFRVKRLNLGREYERFIAEHLEPGGVILQVECRRTWPTTKVDDRYYFQMGALGGATPEEFLHGSERVEAYLARYGSHRRRWDPPEPDSEAPEAEWGFEPALARDIDLLAQRKGYRVVPVHFEEPEHLSHLVADLYRGWYRERGFQANRLLVESFILMEPYWTLRTGSVPYWMKFNMEPSAEALGRYLDGTEPYDEIRMMLFNHGVECVGLVGIDGWRELLGRARRTGSFVGLDEEKYPLDFGSIARYHTELKKVPARYPLPGFLTLGQLQAFLDSTDGRYPVRWLERPGDAWEAVRPPGRAAGESPRERRRRQTVVP